jgi:A/G-specific adenine glycosylase
VSEIMLQQTRVDTVVPYYERFLDRFPDVRALARARESEVLAAWSGLGYYGRARNLRAAAASIVRERAGTMPRDPAALRALPGIGDYTAAAIASVAFGLPAAAVDGNVIRVIARIAGLEGRRDSAVLRRAVKARAEVLVHGPRPGDWTQALMELGATVCRPREPLCSRCPARPGCRAARSGDPARFPEPARSPRPKAARRIMLVVRRGPRVLMIPNDSKSGTTWTLPTATAMTPAHAPRAAASLARRMGCSGKPKGPVSVFRHRTFAEDLTLEVWEAAAPSRSPAPARRWIQPARLRSLPVRSPTLKVLTALRRRLRSRSAGRSAKL